MAELALAIVPLCLSAISGAKYIKSKLKILRHFDKEAARLRKKLKSQVGLFLDECQLLLRDSGIELDLADDGVALEAEEHEEQLKSHLCRKYDEVRDAVEQISEQITSLGEELAKLDGEYASDKGKLARAAQNTRNAVGVLRNKSRLEEDLTDLAASTADLRRLRKMASKMCSSREVVKPKKIRDPRQRILPKTYGMVARYSTSFHEVLSRRWSCLNANGTHVTHTAKLLLDIGTTTDNLDLKLVLEYESISGSLRQKSLLLVRVRSEDLTWLETGLLTPGSSVHLSAPGSSLEPPAKVRRVRFAECSSVRASARASATALLHQPTSQKDGGPAQISTAALSNLCESKDLCRDVFKCTMACQSPAAHGRPQQETVCIGYLDSTCDSMHLRHRLLMASDREATAIQASSEPSKPLSSILRPEDSSSLPINERLKLALHLARSVLRFHSTAWWRRTWTLADLAYFDIDSELSSSLGTLHIATGLLRPSGSPYPSPPGMEMEMEEMQDVICAVPRGGDNNHNRDYEDAGIPNPTMHSLGAALLQIGRWQGLDVRDVRAVRRASAQKSLLGPRYDALVRKCLDCDFGCGRDLTRLPLQCAVYEGVVCELEDMVGFLEGDGGVG